MIQYLSKIFKLAIIYALVMAINPANAQTDPSLLFAKGFGNEHLGGGANEVLDIKIDGSGNRYMTGYSTGTFDFDLGEGVANLTGFGSTDIFLAKYDASGNYLWAKMMGGVGADQGASLALDGSGNVLLTGYFRNTAFFDAVNLQSSGNSDVFLAKYDASGNYLWARRMGGIFDDKGASLTLDGSGNVVLTGSFINNADFYSGAGIVDSLHTSPQGNNPIQDIDIFLAKYDASGNLLWADSMGGLGIDQGASLALDGSGNVLLTGYFTGKADFNPNWSLAPWAIAYLTSTNLYSSDIFLAKYDALGNYVWAKRIGGSNHDQGASLALDSSGNVVLTGNFGGTVDFDPGTGTVNLTSAGDTDIFLAKYDASGNYLWAKRMGGTSTDKGYLLSLDGSDNVLVTGYFNSTADFDPGADTVNLTSAGGNDIFLAKYDALGNYVWAKSMGGTGIDVGASLALDGTGNVMLTGSFSVTADFDPGVGTTNRSTGFNAINGFVAAYTSATGEYVNSGVLSSTPATSVESKGITRDGSGNVYVTGNFYGMVDFDPGAGTANLFSVRAGYSDIFLAKYDASGNYLWAISVGGTNTDQGTSLALDGSGNVVVTGIFNGTADFDPSASIANLTSAGGYDIFLAKYDASGNYLWAKSMGGSVADVGTSLTLDGSGNVFVTGYFGGTADFDPSASTANLTNAGIQDIFIAKYNSSGDYVWAKGIGGTGTDQGTSLALDGSGNVVVTGIFYGTADFDPSASAANLTSAGDYDIFLAKYDASGNYLWAKSMGGSVSDVGTSLTLDGSGNVFVTGYFGGTADFDPGADTANLASAGIYDIFLAKYNSSGNYLWAIRGGSNLNDQGASLALDSSGNVVLTGYFAGTADFDPGAGTANLTSMGNNSDIFIAQ